jgi:hypothetical protein
MGRRKGEGSVVRRIPAGLVGEVDVLLARHREVGPSFPGVSTALEEKPQEPPKAEPSRGFSASGAGAVKVGVVCWRCQRPVPHRHYVGPMHERTCVSFHPVAGGDAMPRVGVG